MIQIIQAYSGQKEKLYCVKDTLEEAKNLLNLIKSNFEIIIGDSENGFYGKVTRKWSNPVSYYIQY